VLPRARYVTVPQAQSQAAYEVTVLREQLAASQQREKELLNELQTMEATKVRPPPGLVLSSTVLSLQVTFVYVGLFGLVGPIGAQAKLTRTEEVKKLTEKRLRNTERERQEKNEEVSPTFQTK
jgi:hypothetical protein